MPGVPKNHSLREGQRPRLSDSGFESLLRKEAESTAPHPALARAQAPPAEPVRGPGAGLTGFLRIGPGISQSKSFPPGGGFSRSPIGQEGSPAAGRPCGER